jgi:hypothetical protein
MDVNPSSIRTRYGGDGVDVSVAVDVAKRKRVTLPNGLDSQDRPPGKSPTAIPEQDLKCELSATICCDDVEASILVEVDQMQAAFVVPVRALAGRKG